MAREACDGTPVTGGCTISMPHWALRFNRGRGMQTGAFPMLETCGRRSLIWALKFKGSEGQGGWWVGMHACMQAGEKLLRASFGVSGGVRLGMEVELRG